MKRIIALIILVVTTTACNLKQQKEDAVKARHKADSIVDEFYEVDRRLEQENLEIMESNNKLLDSLQHSPDSHNSQRK